jgi:hypothetical protein
VILRIDSWDWIEIDSLLKIRSDFCFSVHRLLFLSRLMTISSGLTFSASQQLVRYWIQGDRIVSTLQWITLCKLFWKRPNLDNWQWCKEDLNDKINDKRVRLLNAGALCSESHKKRGAEIVALISLAFRFKFSAYEFGQQDKLAQLAVNGRQIDDLHSSNISIGIHSTKNTPSLVFADAWLSIYRQVLVWAA